MHLDQNRERKASQPQTSEGGRIGELLYSHGLLTREQIHEVLEHQSAHCPNKLFGEIVVQLGLATAEDLTPIIANLWGVPFVVINQSSVNRSVVKLLPRQFLDQHNLLPLSLVDEVLTIAVEDFTNVFVVEEIRRLSGYELEVVTSKPSDIRSARELLGSDNSAVGLDNILDEMDDDEVLIVKDNRPDYSNLEDTSVDSPVIKLVNHVIYSAIQEQASDIHIEPGELTARVRYRADGVLYEKIRPPCSQLPAIISRIKIMAGMDIAERRVPQDGAITVELEGRPIDLRVSTMPVKFGEKAVLRVIDNQKSNFDLGILGFELAMLSKFRRLVHQPNGVVLVTGPTGSGKSTTLYACLSELIDETLNISTVEDPVENNLFGVNQSQVNAKAGFTFARALRTLLRQDPDVIMVGEIRDNETAKISIQAALTGHLVLSTLHTNDAPSAVTRLNNMGVEPYLVAATLRGILAQRLARRICEHCKEETEIAVDTREILLQMNGGEFDIGTVYAGKGCPACRNTGLRGRLGIYELLVLNDTVLEAVASGATLQDLRRLLTRASYTTLRQDGIEKVKAGAMSVDALLEVVGRSDDLFDEEVEVVGKAA